MPVYHIQAINTNGSQVSIEVVYNPTTEEGTLVDMAEVHPEVAVSTTSTTKPISGVSTVLTTNVKTIKESKEYTKIVDFLIKNHPESEIE